MFHRRIMICIFSAINQGVVTYEQNKLGLSAYYDKRYVVADGIHTRPLEFWPPSKSFWKHTQKKWKMSCKRFFCTWGCQKGGRVNPQDHSVVCAETVNIFFGDCFWKKNVQLIFFYIKDCIGRGGVGRANLSFEDQYEALQTSRRNCRLPGRPW